MHLILLSGGAGRRLWPISTPTRAKQFIKLLKSPDGRLESMAQRIWRQLTAKDLTRKTVIACAEAHVDSLISQLGPDVQWVSEPEQRDTFPAVALGCTYLHHLENLDDDEIIIVAPIDAYVEEDFFDCFEKLTGLIGQGAGEVGLIGISPTAPSSSFGYMVPYSGDFSQAGQSLADNEPEFWRIKRFAEKPALAEAQALIAQGALWNGGVFAFRLGFIRRWLLERAYPTHYEILRQTYASLPRISFDYAVLEQAQDIVAVKYEGNWLDLGTWDALTTKLAPVSGPGLISPDSSNCHIINELNIPILALAASNLVVAAGPDGILVASKEASPHLKEYLPAQAKRPMFEERRWGWYLVLDHTHSLDGYEILTKKLHLAAGKNLSYQVHNMRTEVWTITSGNGLFAQNGTIFPVKSGDILHIPSGTQHGLKALSPLELIEVQSGINLVEEDIIRLCLTWEETAECCSYPD